MLFCAQEQDAKRAKRRRPEFDVAQDDFQVDLTAFSELAVSKRPSAGGTLALRDKSNALFLPKLEGAVAKKTALSSYLSKPLQSTTTGTSATVVCTFASYPATNPPLSPKPLGHDGANLSTLQSTPARRTSSPGLLPSPGLGSGIFSHSIDDLSERAELSEGIPTSSAAHPAGPRPMSTTHDGTTSGEEDFENDSTLADLLKGSLAIKEPRTGLAPSSSASFIPRAPLSKSGSLMRTSSESAMEGQASDTLPPIRPVAGSTRREKVKRKKSALKMASTGSLKSKKKAVKEVSFSSGGEAGPASAKKKRSSSVPIAKMREDKANRGPKGSIIRDVAIKAESSASADEIAF